MKRRMRDGGLYRCCVKTLSEYSGSEAVGTSLVCETHPADGNMMVVAADGVWEWSGAAAVAAGFPQRQGGAAADGDR